MKKIKSRSWGLFVALAATIGLMTGACGGDQGSLLQSPTVPSAVFDESPVASAPDTSSSSASSAPADVSSSTRYACADTYEVIGYSANGVPFGDGDRIVHGSTIQVRVRSNTLPGTEDMKAHLAVFALTDPQTLLGSDVKEFKDTSGNPKREKTLNVQLPEDECLNLQIDLGCTENIPADANYGDGAYATFKEAVFVSTDYCGIRQPTPTPPPPTPTPTPEPSCEGYEAPIITGDIAFEVKDDVVLFSEGTVGSGGSFSPSLPTAISRPEAGQPAGSFSTTYTVFYGPEELECSVSKEFTGEVPPKDPPTCDDYEAPTITGDIAADLKKKKVTFSQGTVGPSGGSFDPSLPATIDRPEYGEPAESFSTTYTVFYGPENLQCKVSKTFTKEVPPQESECQTPDFWNQSVTTNKNFINGEVHVRGKGLWVLKLFATSKRSEYPNNPDYTKDTDTKFILCKGQGELKVKYRWKNHNSKWWWVALYHNGNRVWLSPAIPKS